MPQTYFLDGAATVHHRPSDPIHGLPPCIRIDLRAVETQSPDLAIRYQNAIDQATASIWDHLAEARSHTASTSEAQALGNLERQYAQALSRLQALDSEVRESERRNLESQADGTLDVADIQEHNRLVQGLADFRRTVQTLDQAVRTARTRYRALVQTAVESARAEVLKESAGRLLQAQEALAQAILEAGIDLAVEEALQLRFGGNWYPDSDCFRSSTPPFPKDTPHASPQSRS
jgi:hypothetical protein